MTTQELPNANATDKPCYCLFGSGPLHARTYHVYFCPSAKPQTWTRIGPAHTNPLDAQAAITEYLRLRQIARDIGARLA